MPVDFERLAMHGTAPVDGCSVLGVGYDDAFERLRRRFIIDRFDRGGSLEKFVIGPFGSGKTHFLRQLSEMARAEGCVTAEVALTRDVDVVNALTVYKEVANEIRRPDTMETGIRTLLAACISRVRESAGSGPTGDAI